MKRLFLTDKEVAASIEVSEKTLYRMMLGFTPRRTRSESSIDLRDAHPICVNGRRRWRVDEVARVLGVSVEELEKRIA